MCRKTIALQFKAIKLYSFFLSIWILYSLTRLGSVRLCCQDQPTWPATNRPSFLTNPPMIPTHSPTSVFIRVYLKIVFGICILYSHHFFLSTPHYLVHSIHWYNFIRCCREKFTVGYLCLFVNWVWHTTVSWFALCWKLVMKFTDFQCIFNDPFVRCRKDTIDLVLGTHEKGLVMCEIKTRVSAIRLSDLSLFDWGKRPTLIEVQRGLD